MDSQPDLYAAVASRAALDGDGLRRWELFNRDEPAFVRLARRLLGNADDAEDLVQEVGVRVLLHPTGPRESDCFRAWCYGLLRNAAMDFRRSAARRRRGDHVGLEKLAGSADPSQTDLDVGLDARRFVGQYDPLDDFECELLVRRYVLEQTSSEIAAELRTSAPAIRMKLKRTLAKLRRGLGHA